MKKVLLGVLCVILAGLLGFGLLQSKRRDRAQTLMLEEINQKLGDLRSQKIELETKLAGLKKENDDQSSGMATFSLMVTDLSAEFMGQLLPAVEAAELPAVMALSQEQFPGERGLVTLEVFQQRLEAGWDYCVAWNGQEDYDSWYADMAQRLEGIGLAMPDVLYCAEFSYTEDVEAAAVAKGVATIVHSGEKNLPIIDTEFASPWKMGAVRWIASGARNSLEQAVEKHGNMVFTVDSVDFYETEFTAMLNLVKQCQGEETLIAGTFAETRAYRQQVVLQNEQMQDEAYKAQVTELTEEIEAVKADIQSLLNQK